MTEAENSIRSPRSSELFVAFGILWSLATLFHLAQFDDWAKNPPALVLTLAATVYLIDPQSLKKFLFFILAQTLSIFVDLPRVTNHWLFSFFVAITILAAYASLRLRSKRAGCGKEELFECFAPIVRIELVILYFFVVFHKLNSDFLSPETSCAASHYRDLAQQWSFLPMGDWVSYWAIYGTLAIEGLILICLVVPRLRLLGIAIASVFHFTLALNDFYNFSAMLFAVFPLFVPEAVAALIRRWKDLVGEGELSNPSMQRIGFRVGKIILVLLLAGIAFGGVDSVAAGRALFNAYGLLYVLATLSLIPSRAAWSTSLPGARFFLPNKEHRTLMLLPMLVILNGSSPYLGLKTETSFAMFSNLRTIGGLSNHLLVGAGVQIFDYQKIYWQADASGEPIGEPVLHYQVRQFVEQNPNKFKSARLVQHDGQSLINANALGGSPSYLEKKFFLFQSLQLGPTVSCSH